MPIKLFVLFCSILHLSKCSVLLTTSAPPQPFEYPKMARYILRNSGTFFSKIKFFEAQTSLIADWVSVATISTQTQIKGYPFVGLKSVSDGTDTNSTGIPYLYMTDMDVSGKDLIVGI